MALTLYINRAKVDYKSLVFKGGEVHVKLPPMGDQLFNNQALSTVAIRANLFTSNDVMELLMLNDALRREIGERFPIDLLLPYVPYARQDRVCDRGEALSVKVFADLINSMKFNRINVWDPHSDVAPALLNNCTIIPAYKFVDKVLDTMDRNNVVLISPDAGASKKIMGVAQYCRVENVIKADKIRNVKNGEITGTAVYDKGGWVKDFLIVDDIADGGRTFIELAKVLKPLTHGRIMLYVTHGIFSAGFDGLKEHISRVYTANPFVDLDKVSDYVTQVSL